MRFTHLILLSALVSISAGCAVTETRELAESEAPNVDFQKIQNPRFERIKQADSAYEKDREAILAMQGEYVVDFNFLETVPLQTGYERQAKKSSGGYEAVFVVEKRPEKVVLQHLLVTASGVVIKHWRQDWVYEASSRFEFVDDQTWQVVDIAPEKTTKAWTQCVYQVSDAPRYCGTGQWNHRYGVSTWTSDRTWRPLPRREYTKRDDYNVINAENRHTVTSHGWTHEQDNTKTLRDGERTQATLVREFGFNDYRSIKGFDFSPASAYWAKTAEYWQRVRAAWERRLQPNDRLVLKTAVDGMPIIHATFAQAENAENVDADEQLQAIESVLNEWTTNTTTLSQR